MQDSFIIDNGLAGEWVWIGKKASPKEKQEAMRNAVGFLKKKEYPSDTKVTRVVEGAEPSDFKCLFRDWPQPAPTGKVYARSRIGKIAIFFWLITQRGRGGGGACLFVRAPCS